MTTRGRVSPMRIVVAAPEAVAAGVAGFSVPAMVLLLAGHFSPALVLPIGALGALVAVWFCGLPDGPVTVRAAGYHLAAAVFAVGWFVYNHRYTAQDVYATRDPATYTITGRWLVDHPSLQIATHGEIFGSPVGGTGATGSYAQVKPGVLNSQGNHLLPALEAACSWIFGDGAIFSANVGFTALGLFVFFGLARRIVSEPFALAAMVALGVSMPLIYVGRDTYTEPLTLLFLMGALALAHRAFTTGRIADFALAGLVGGSAAMARIDSYGAVIGLVVAGVVYAAVKRDAVAAARRAVALIVGLGVTTMLGYLDLVKLSRQYYDSQHHNILLLLMALIAVIVASPFVVLIARRRGPRAWLANERTRSRIVVGGNVLLVVVFAALASRPLWQTTRSSFANPNLEAMQRRWNHMVDGTRLYNEQTVHWLALYLGWPTVVLAVVGYALLITMVVQRRSYALAATLAMGLTMSALYLWNSEVAPDQPWAMRRYVPVIMPLLIIAAVVALHVMWQRREHRTAGRSAVAALLVVMIAFPLAVTWPMRHVREEYPQMTQLAALCSTIGKHGAVVEVDENTVFGYGQTLRSFCNIPTISLIDPTPTQLATMNAAVSAHGRKLFVLTQDVSVPLKLQYAPGVGTPPPAFSTVHVQRWPNQINVAPDKADAQTYTVILSTVDSAGLAHPVAAQ